MAAKQIFTNQTSNGPSLTFSLNGSTRVRVVGDFGGGKIEVHSKSNNENDSFSHAGVEYDFTEPREFIIEHKQQWNYQLVLVNAANPDINAFVSD